MYTFYNYIFYGVLSARLWVFIPSKKERNVSLSLTYSLLLKIIILNYYHSETFSIQVKYMYI